MKAEVRITVTLDIGEKEGWPEGYLPRAAAMEHAMELAVVQDARAHIDGWEIDVMTPPVGTRWPKETP